MKEQLTNQLPAAGNGLLDRRLFLSGLLGASLAPIAPVQGAGPSSTREQRKPWMQAPGDPLNPYGQPSKFEAHVTREGIGSQVGTTGSGASRTPLQSLQGTITPSGLHFERHHAGIAQIDPAQHELVIQGAVKQPLRFSMDDLARYPLTSRTYFLECSGNSAANLRDTAPDMTCGQIHGLISASEWSGVPVSMLLDEAGVKPEAAWVVAEGADAARMHRSIPLEKMLDDALIALYQNGERLRPEQGYPLRLFLPGYEGNTSIKWLHRLELSHLPAMSRQETSKYTDLRADGRSEMFTFDMGVKSVITSPSGQQRLQEPGVYEISGLAWSAAGPIKQVEVSADAGQSWALALLETPVLDKSLTRFRIPWRWSGAPSVILSRARDLHEQQPTRATFLERHGASSFYHYNAIQAWQVSADGSVRNSYAYA